MADPGATPACYRFDRFVLEPTRRVLTTGGTVVPLSSRGFDLLLLLVEGRGRVVTKDEILDRVWAGSVVEENNLAVQVSALRRAFGTDGRAFIATVPGRGYRFVAAVVEGPGDVPPSREAFDDAPAPGPAQVPGVPAAPPDRTPWRRRRMIVAAALAILVTAGMLAIGAGMLGGHRKAPRLSIAVLPFRDLSDGGGQDYLADAISDDLTTDLSHLPGSTVIARESADTYKGRAVRAEAIGRALNVRYLLEGSLRREGDTLHLNAQLIDAGNAAHLWAIAFDVPRGGLDDARAIIVRRLASALDFTLVQIEGARSLHERPDNPDAVDLFLRARSTLDRDDTVAGLVAGQRLLEQAVALAPDFSDALAELGLLLLRKIGDYDDPDEWQDHARAVAVISRVAAAAPDNPLVIAARGMLAWEDEKCAEALPSFRLALSLDPDEIPARDGLAQCARDLGQIPAMIAELEDIFRIDPAAPGNAARQNLIGFGELMLGHPAAALDWLERARARFDVHRARPPALGWEEWNAVNLIAALAETGDAAGARALYAQYETMWSHRTGWRLAALLAPAIGRLPGFATYLAALKSAGMPMAADEHEDCGVAPSQHPPAGGDFDPTPLAVPGATTVDTAGLRARLAGAPPPVVLDVGRGAAVPAGAVLVWPMGVWGDQDVLLERAADLGRLPVRRDIVVMGDGTFGWSGYNATLHLVAHRYDHVLWYRGGEEAWAAAGLPGEDRRP